MNSVVRLAPLLMLTCTLHQIHAGNFPDWNQWRGPGRNAAFSGPKWPASLDPAHLKLTWHRDLEPSYSGPLLTQTRVFVTETVDKQFERVSALDRRDGRVVWSSQWEGSMSVPFFAKANGSWIRSTPTLHDGRLYVGGMRDVVVCLNAEDGTVIWKRDFPKETGSPLPSFGNVCSPLVDESGVYTQAGGAVMKLDRLTGKTLWKSLEDGGGMGGSAFSSPILATILESPVLLVQTRENLAGLDPSTGKALWTQPIKAFRGMNILTPVVLEDGSILTATYGGRTELWRPVKQGESISLKQLWSAKFQGYMSNPAIVGDHAYLHMRNQRVVCIDLKDGSEKWTTPKGFGKYWSHLIQGDRFLVLDESGSLMLIQANPKEFELLSNRNLETKEIWAHIAMQEKSLAIRDLNGISLWEWQRSPLTARVP